MIFDILILGSGSSVPKLGYYSPAQVLFHDTDKIYLLDCGEGTQLSLLYNNVSINKITKIFITHLHGDHFFGLLGLLSSMSNLQRKKQLDIYAPTGLDEIIKTTFKITQSNITYNLNIHAIDTTKSNVIIKDRNLISYSIPLRHSVPCCGFLFKEIKKNNIDKSKIDTYNLSITSIKNIKAGNDITIGGQTFNAIFFKEKYIKPLRSYAYITDTLYCESIIPIIKNTNLIYHEATYIEENKTKAIQTYHSTAKQAALIAKKANVKNLLLGHFSNRYTTPARHIQEAQEVFHNSYYAQQYKTFQIF